MNDFAIRLKQIRKEKGLTQKQLAIELGASERGIQQYELGERKPAYDFLISLADYFDISLDYLTGRTIDSTPLSYHSEWEKTFRERLGELLPSLDRTDLQDAGISVNYLESIAFKDFPLTFHTACDIADELGESLDYLTGRTDKREVNR